MKFRSYESTYALLFFVLLSIASMVAYLYSDGVRLVARSLSVLSAPVHLLAASPVTAYRWLNGSLESKEKLEQDLAELNQRQLVLQTRLHRLKALESENERLRKLLKSASGVSDKIQLAEIVEVNLHGYSNTILINRGTADGVVAGLPVIDEGGVVGQVTRPGPFRSAVTLVTDPGQGVPVQTARTGLRTIIFGTGKSGGLHVLFVERNADIRIGDLLVTSGLGGTYPSDYPVARVSEIQRNVNAPFMTVRALPTARLDKGREVVLVWRDTGLSHGQIDQESVTGKASRND